MFIVLILYFIYFYIIVYFIILSYIYFISTLQAKPYYIIFIYINIKFLYVYSFNIILPSVMTQFKTLCGSENHVFVPQMCRGTIFTKTTEMIKSPKMFLVNITQIGAVHENLICIILY